MKTTSRDTNFIPNFYECKNFDGSNCLGKMIQMQKLLVIYLVSTLLPYRYSLKQS